MKEKLYETAMDFLHLYSICQQKCDGMKSCKMFVEENDKGCLKNYHYYLKLIKEEKFEKI